MNSGNETAVDSIVGLKLDYAGKDGWSATATGRRPEPELQQEPAYSVITGCGGSIVRRG